MKGKIDGSKRLAYTGLRLKVFFRLASRQREFRRIKKGEMGKNKRVRKQAGKTLSRQRELPSRHVCKPQGALAEGNDGRRSQAVVDTENYDDTELVSYLPITSVRPWCIFHRCTSTISTGV